MLNVRLLALFSFLFLISGCNLNGFPDQSGDSEPVSDDPVTEVEERFPEVQRVEFADNTPGDIQVTVFHNEADDGFEFDIFFSRNDGESWQPARIQRQESHTIPVQSGNETVFIWERVKDLGLRSTAPVLMRIIPANSEWTGDAFIAAAPVPDSPHAVISSIDSPIIYYDRVDEAAVAHLEAYQLAVVHPVNGELTRDIVADIQDGVDPLDPADDVLVLCYISVGEDLRTVALSDEQMRADPRFQGDGSGPRVDPRGILAWTGSLDNIDPVGLPSPGGSGFASWYLDDNSVSNDPNGMGDGLPDRNSLFGAAFVNAGDPAWFEALQEMTFQDDGVPGMREILTTDFGLGLGCDGLFLDTIDTAAPNSFTDSNSPNQSEFEWTAPGFTTFIQRLRNTYPNALIMQNRGLFYFNPDFPHYAYNAGADIDFLLFESYRLDSNTNSEFNAYFYADNKFNYTPKIMAEANRRNGFKVISLGYAEGPVESIAKETLLGQNSLGLETLLTDILEAQEHAGFRHYITDGGITLLNHFVQQNSDFSDLEPPRWTSTYNANRNFYPQPHDAPDPRVGVQQVVPLEQAVLLRWDVALDKHGVKYVAYYQQQPFDFSRENPFAEAVRVILEPEAGEGYAQGVGPDVYPHQARIDGLTSGGPYYFVIRAVDDSQNANEDDNEVVLSAVLY